MKKFLKAIWRDLFWRYYLPKDFEEYCERRKNCGYEKADKDHQRWDAENDEFGGEE